MNQSSDFDHWALVSKVLSPTIWIKASLQFKSFRKWSFINMSENWWKNDDFFDTFQSYSMKMTFFQHIVRRLFVAKEKSYNFVFLCNVKFSVVFEIWTWVWYNVSNSKKQPWKWFDTTFNEHVNTYPIAKSKKSPPDIVFT